MKVEIEISEEQVRSVFYNDYQTREMVTVALRKKLSGAFDAAIGTVDLVPFVRERIDIEISKLVNELVERRLRKIARAVVNREIEKLKAPELS